MEREEIDIVVIGGGNAALCAALSVAEQRTRARVVILESSPQNVRGGNSRHTRNLRIKHNAPIGVLSGSYCKDEYMDDLLKVTEGATDRQLAHCLIDSSEECYGWMQQHGVRFQAPLSGTLSLSRTNAFFLGGGKALLNAYYRSARKLGITIRYESEVIDIQLHGQRINAIEYLCQHKRYRVHPHAVIVASGGYESNVDWLAQYWGKAAYNFVIRGTPYNQGKVLKRLLEQNVRSLGDGKQCHAVAVDGKSPKYDGGIATRLDCVPFSLVVNKYGKRIYNEGEDIWPKRYAIWGRLIAKQPEQIAYAVIDAKADKLFMTPLYPPVTATTLTELAKKLQLPCEQFTDQVRRFNAACTDTTNFNPTSLDGVATFNLSPPKTNWARPIDTPPFSGFCLKTGITFTYMGLQVDQNAQCSNQCGRIDNLWAAGEIMAGSILGKGYLAGIGMTIGSVFGRIAGRQAAKYVA